MMRVLNADFDGMDGCSKTTKKEADIIRNMLEDMPRLGEALRHTIAAIYATSDDLEEMQSGIDYVIHELRIFRDNVRNAR